MESFIRSKYESRRWALEGPPPAGPFVLEDGVVSNTTAEPAVVPEPQAQISAPPNQFSLHLDRYPASTKSAVTDRQPQAHRLLSTQHSRSQSIPKLIPGPDSTAQQHQHPTGDLQAVPKAPENDL